METVKSRDGTRIAYRRSGAGPPLVVVHETAADHTRWAAMLPQIEPHFTVYALDRRGRGESGDTPPYALEREVEDVVAVVHTIVGTVNLLGLGFGAICALEATLRTRRLRRLILYEPPVPAHGELPVAGALERIEDLLDAGDREGAVQTYLREVAGYPDDAIGLIRGLASWPGREAAAQTIPRELRVRARYALDPVRFHQTRLPALLLIGDGGPPSLRTAAEAVATALPNSRIAVLPGGQRAVIDTDPELFVGEVVAFLAEAD